MLIKWFNAAKRVIPFLPLFSLRDPACALLLALVLAWLHSKPIQHKGGLCVDKQITFYAEVVFCRLLNWFSTWTDKEQNKRWDYTARNREERRDWWMVSWQIGPLSIRRAWTCQLLAAQTKNPILVMFKSLYAFYILQRNKDNRLLSLLK